GRVHYLVCDRTGDCAAFEYVRGKLVVSRGAHVLTNDTYADSRAFVAAGRPVESSRPSTSPSAQGRLEGVGSLARFARVERHVAKPQGAADAWALRVLDSENCAHSQWHILYEPSALRVRFRTQKMRAWKTIDLARAVPGCGPPKILDLDTDGA